MTFPTGAPGDLADLIRSHPLAWLVTSGAEGFDASALPLVAETGPDGEVVALIGHCARTNPQVAALRQEPRAWALFMGAQGYVSPGHVSKAHWVPTWNYAVAVLTLEVELREVGTEEAVRLLVDEAEADRPVPWRMEDAGSRAPQMLSRIIGFRAAITDRDLRFKLGQDEDLPTLREILAGLEGTKLAAAMHRANAGRLAPAAQDVPRL
ncbi:FMN-binding negative transcriptional regulator [Novosphingobium profundi]|uniref:FMN-binding negative transcriptional regulator n=1 Tax=Novosphingobium profundi TaxID=1774954 RepID=UPI001CFE0266|nr:FMN-binding negative transcriptional regulator [Novosphingobium profundi]